MRNQVMWAAAAVVLGTLATSPPAAARTTPAKGAAVPGKAAAAPKGPYIAVVSLDRQRVSVYGKDGLVTSSPVSTGQRGRDTPQGVFSIIAKEVDHQSTLYNDAQMPFMQRITWSGVALHAGNLPGYPASHGCIRLPWDFAQSLFALTPMHTRVVVAPGDAPPAPISHPVLFQPRTGAGDSTPLPSAQALVASTAQQAAAALTAATNARATVAATRNEARKADRLARLAEDGRNRAQVRATQTERVLGAASTPTRADRARAAHAKTTDDLTTATGRAAEAAALAATRAAEAKAAQADSEARTQASQAAETAASEAARLAEPVTVLVSRTLQKIYVRQAQHSVLEVPFTVKDPDRPIGTQVFTAMASSGSGTLAWNVLKVASVEPDPAPLKVKGKSKAAAPAPGPSAHDQAIQALDRIAMPQDVLDRVTPYLQPGSSLIVSDLGPSFETGRGTDLVVQTQGEERAIEAVRHIVAQTKGWKRAVELVRPPT